MPAPESSIAAAHAAVLERIRTAAAGTPGQKAVRLLAVSKGKPADAIRALAGLGQRAFGENYLQEASGKMTALADLALEWHFIGRLQSNKCREVAARFAWVQSVDRPRLVPLLADGRTAGPPLQVLLQVNVEGEQGKGGCTPEALPALAGAVAGQRGLQLRGLMAIPAPHPDARQRRDAFARVRMLYEALRRDHPGMDTLSMGMSADLELAIAEGADLVRVGTALFGPRD